MTDGPAGEVAAGRVTVARDLCVSSGMCESVAPAVFEIDDDGELVVLQDVVPGALLADAQAAARSCPTRALKVS